MPATTSPRIDAALSDGSQLTAGTIRLSKPDFPTVATSDIS